MSVNDLAKLSKMEANFSAFAASMVPLNCTWVSPFAVKEIVVGDVLGAVRGLNCPYELESLLAASGHKIALRNKNAIGTSGLVSR